MSLIILLTSSNFDCHVNVKKNSYARKQNLIEIFINNGFLFLRIHPWDQETGRQVKQSKSISIYWVFELNDDVVNLVKICDLRN